MIDLSKIDREVNVVLMRRNSLVQVSRNSLLVQLLSKVINIFNLVRMTDITLISNSCLKVIDLLFNLSKVNRTAAARTAASLELVKLIL